MRMFYVFLLTKVYEMKFENSVVTLNVTRDLIFCLTYSYLKLRQIEVKFLSFYLLIVIKYCSKYRRQKIYLSYKREKILSICHARFLETLSREMIMCMTITYN
jgi:hypothetical protein